MVEDLIVDLLFLNLDVDPDRNKNIQQSILPCPYQVSKHHQFEYKHTFDNSF